MADTIIADGAAELQKEKDRRDNDARFALGQGPSGPKQ
jgi:hypothetical protein